MPCFSPLKGWLSEDVNPSGKRSIVFSKADALAPPSVLVPCGKCIGCRLERSRQWAIRCVHEASLYEDNCFITLTYNDAFVPLKESLCHDDFQLFMKRLRKEFGQGIRYFMCGEYGEVCANCGLSEYYCKCGNYVSSLGRPHYHACLFNFRFDDLVLWSVRDGVKLYRSAQLESLWSDVDTGYPLGFCTVGDVTFESAAYVARYVTKKVYKNKYNPNHVDNYYKDRDCEYARMSRGCKKLGTKGIGYGWYKKFKNDVYPHGFVVIRGGFKSKPPLYYDSKYELTDKDSYDKLKLEKSKACFNDKDSSPDRLRTREEVLYLRGKKLKRGYENGA